MGKVCFLVVLSICVFLELLCWGRGMFVYCVSVYLFVELFLCSSYIFVVSICLFVELFFVFVACFSLRGGGALVGLAARFSRVFSGLKRGLFIF